MALSDFGRSVNPISTRGTDYAHLITTGTPGFSDLPTALSKYHLELSFTTNSTEAVGRSENPGVPLVIRWA